MAQFQCCGVNSYTDFDTSPSWISNRGPRTVPEACCILTDKTLITPRDPSCIYSPSDANSYYMKVRFCVFCKDLLIPFVWKVFQGYPHDICRTNFFFYFDALTIYTQSIIHSDLNSFFALYRDASKLWLIIWKWIAIQSSVLRVDWYSYSYLRHF